MLSDRCLVERNRISVFVYVLSAAGSADPIKDQRLFASPRHIFQFAVLHFRDCAGVTGNALIFSIISLRVAVRRQLDVPIIVEIDYVLGRIRANRNRLGFSRYRRVVIGSDGGFRRLCPERLVENGLGRLDRNFSSVPVVVHRVAQVGLRLEYRFELRLPIQTILLIQIRSGLFIRQSRIRAFNRLFGGNPDPAIKFISFFRVGRYGLQFIDKGII